MTTEIKYFTPAEARKTLPLVKKIVYDILQTSKEMRLIAEELNGMIGGNTDIEKLTTDLEGFFIELEEIGCFFKDWNFAIGLVDFPAFINDNEVYLCWRSDEDEIKFYHGIQEGYAGRKPIPDEYFMEE